MKRIWFTLAIACLASAGTARADVWGRVIPNSLNTRTQVQAEPVPSPAVEQSNVQAPAASEDFNGYPFTDRCGNGASCCANVWNGYSRSCGHGFTRGGLVHGGLVHGGRDCGCNRQHAQGGYSSCGGCANSFAGGGFSSCHGCGGSRGHGWHGGSLHGFGGCVCGRIHQLHGHLHGLWHACGLGCNKGCNQGCETKGCESCNGQSHKQDGAEKQIMNPPTAPIEASPIAEDGPTAATAPADQKSAFRSFPTTSRRSAGF